ncbi:MAG: ribosome maturation factor RimP [Candidatus Omnitrophota bacterium]
MIPDDVSNQVQGLIKSLVSQAGCDLVELNVHSCRGEVRLQVIVDWPSGGITVEECSALNRRIAQRIEEGQLLSDNYTIEVSSPGVDRPLQSEKDFLRVRNRHIRVFVAEPVGTKMELSGRLAGIEGQKVILKRDDQEIVIPFSNIKRAVQMIE